MSAWRSTEPSTRRTDTAYPPSSCSSDDEGVSEEVTQLVLAREPDDLVLLDAVEGPLGRAVEADDVAGLEVVDVDREVADDEDLLLHARHGEHEAVTRRGGST